jgi:RND superfamily putative drug exporter
MSNYLYRLARFAFRRRRLVLAVWLAAAIAAIAIAQASGGKTNDTFTIPGTEAQNAATVLAAKLPAFSGGQTTIVFATTNGSAKVTDPAAEAAIESAWPSSSRFRRSPRSPIPSRVTWCRRMTRSPSGRCSGRHRRPA